MPNVKILAKPCFLGPADLFGLPLQVIALPWIYRSGWLASGEDENKEIAKANEEIESRLTELIHTWIEGADPDLPLILTAHASIEGAEMGNERTVSLGGDLTLPASLVKDQRLDYVALGHIHKPQDLNKGRQPPVIYPGSIERVDFSEAADDKFFIIAKITHGNTEVEWRKLTQVRPFINCTVNLTSDEGVTERLLQALPPAEQLKDAIVRLTIDFPSQWESLIDDAALRQATAEAFEFHLIKHPLLDVRSRLEKDQLVSSMGPLELLEIYWKTKNINPPESEALQKLAGEIIHRGVGD